MGSFEEEVCYHRVAMDEAVLYSRKKEKRGCSRLIPSFIRELIETELYSSVADLEIDDINNGLPKTKETPSES